MKLHKFYLREKHLVYLHSFLDKETTFLFLEEAEKQKKINKILKGIKHKTPPSILIDCIYWKNTKQGYDFWADIAYKTIFLFP